MWSNLLCVMAAINVAAWSLSTVALNRRQSSLSAQAFSARRLQLLLSAVYVFGCAYRSVFLVYDVPRICLFDSVLSSAIVGRTVATVAELCFVGQWALLLRESSRATGSVVAESYRSRWCRSSRSRRPAPGIPSSRPRISATSPKSRCGVCVPRCCGKRGGDPAAIRACTSARSRRLVPRGPGVCRVHVHGGCAALLGALDR